MFSHVFEGGNSMNPCKISGLTALIFFLFLGYSASAATFTVNQSNDTGDGTCDVTCTLRDAIDDANNSPTNDAIDFNAGLTTIALTSEIVIENNGTLDISGLGANVLTIDAGAGPWRIFYTNGATVTITGVTLTGGNGSGTIVSGNGGAIFANGGSLTLDRVHLTGNTTATADFGGGGVYFASGSHAIRNSTFSGNNGVGGAIQTGSGTLTIANSTISGNSSSSSFAGGGGLFSHHGNITLRNVTIANNTAAASTGGGISLNGVGTINFGNTIIAGNTATAGQPEIYFNGFGTITSVGNNQVGDSTGDAADTSSPVTYQGSDILDIPTELVALGLYGGTTPVHPLQFSSPARDAGSDALATAAGLTTDQRGTGFPRIVDTAGGTDDVDIGAFEIQDTRYYVTQTANDTGACDANCALREAVTAVPAGGTIDFARSLSGQTLVLGGSEIVINNNLTIAGLGANQLTISGSNTSRIFHTTATITIADVTLTGGNGTGVSSGFAGAIFANGGSLTLERANITGNSAASAGGGVYFSAGTGHRIRNSTFSANGSGIDCGGFHNLNGTLTIVNSTISGNMASTGSGGGFCSAGFTTLRNVTISNNTSNTGGGFVCFQLTLSLGNTIVAGNTASGANPPEIHFVGGTITSAGNNLVGDSVGDAANTLNPITYQGTDILDTPPLLGALQNNGGQTPTLALISGSPAIDAGSNALALDPFDGSPLATDQRGFGRIIDAPPTSVPVVDIGAYEAFGLSPTAANVVVSGRVLTRKGRGISSARVCLSNNTGDTRCVVTNTFGYFKFEEVQTGIAYGLTARHKRYRFEPILLIVNDELSGLTIVSEDL